LYFTYPEGVFTEKVLHPLASRPTVRRLIARAAGRRDVTIEYLEVFFWKCLIGSPPHRRK
jgi:hypothetical protein